MASAKFILSKKILRDQVNKLKDLGLKISYSYKTNKQVGSVLQDISDVDFSIHSFEELSDIENKSRIWFFTQAESVEELKNLLKKGVRKFVVDNIVDCKNLIDAVSSTEYKIILSLRMKFIEHRIGTGKYFVYGMDSKVVDDFIQSIINENIVSLGIHVHRKSQNITEWNIKEELIDSLSEATLEKIDFVNFGGGLPSVYRSNSVNVFPYIFKKLREARDFLEQKKIVSYIEPGRFICAPAIRLLTEIIQINKLNIIINTTIYNCALDTVLTGTKLLVEGELDESSDGNFYLIKGNSPTRDDIFRYKVKLKCPKVGDSIVFLNAGAYNYTTDFFGYKKLKTEIVEEF